MIIMLRKTHPVWRGPFACTRYPEGSALISHLLRAPIFCQDLLPTPVQITLYKYPSLEFKVWKCPEYRLSWPWSEVCILLYTEHTSCLPSGLALGLRFYPTLLKMKAFPQNLKVRPASENDPIIQSQWSLCFLTFELCWVSWDLGLGVPTTCTFSDHFSFLLEHADCPPPIWLLSGPIAWLAWRYLF